MSKEIILKCDICRKKDAHELPSWFEWDKSYRGLFDNVVEEYISGVTSRGWARWQRAIYLCKDHHDKLDALITAFVQEQVNDLPKNSLKPSKGHSNAPK
jgi:hypothetical protein